MTFKKNGIGDYVAYNKEWFKQVNELGQTKKDLWDDREVNYEAWDDCSPNIFGMYWERAEGEFNSEMISFMEEK